MTNRPGIRHAGITAVGHYAPPDVLDNKYFESYLDTNDEWIVSRTGIRERRILRTGATSDMAVEAAKLALERRGMTPNDIQLIICCTVTPDMPFPPTATIVQDKLGAKNCFGFDINAACSGFLFGLETASRMIESGGYDRVLLIGGDKMSSIVNYQDRNTSILFGDAAGALILEPVSEEYGIMDSYLKIDGIGREFLYMKGGGSLNPATAETVANGMHYIYQDGKTVFKRAVVDMADSSALIMERNGLKSEDIAYLVPHQANFRILDAARERMGLPMDRVMINIDRYGNTTDATIPMCLSEWWADGKIKKGDNLVLASFGAGYTWGAILVRWAY
ncbi:MAG TPA: beta-ketoacyl-ACP synthase III [Candidatus Kapabacteria bacterium]